MNARPNNNILKVWFSSIHYNMSKLLLKHPHGKIRFSRIHYCLVFLRLGSITNTFIQSHESFWMRSWNGQLKPIIFTYRNKLKKLRSFNHINSCGTERRITYRKNLHHYANTGHIIISEALGHNVFSIEDWLYDQWKQYYVDSKNPKPPLHTFS